MNNARTNVRLGIDGDEDVKRRMRETGEVGDRALKKIADASRPASRGLKAVNAASQEGRAALSAYAAQAGPVGGVLAAIGPAGIAAAAGIGAVVAGMRGAAAAVADFDQIAKTADKIGVTTDLLQEMRFAAGSLAGMTEGALDTSLQRFVRRLAEAAAGTGAAKSALQEMGIPLRDVEGRLRSTDNVMSDVARAMEGLGSDADRLRVATALFGREGAGMVTVLKDSGRAMDETRERARELGIVVENSVLRSAEEMQDKLDSAAKVMDVKLKTALIDLAPLLVDAAEFAARVARGIARIRDEIVALENMSLKGLKDDLSKIDDLIAHWQERLDAGDVVGPFGNSLDGKIAELKKARDEIAGEIGAREVGVTPITPSEILGLPPVGTGVGDTLGKARDTAAELATAMRESADINADIEARARAITLFGEGRVEDAEKRLILAEQTARVERAERDARREGIADGLKDKPLEDAVAAAVAQAGAANRAADSQRALSDARAAASQSAADERSKAAKDAAEDQARAVRNAAEQERVDAGALAAAARLVQQTTTLARAREQGGLLARAAADATLATDREALDLLDRTLQREQDAIRIRAAGEDAARGAGEFDDAEALRAKAEGIAREAIAIRDITDSYAENRRVVVGQAEATRMLADAQASLDAARRSTAPVFAALDEVAAARSLADLDTLRERIEGERDLAAIKAAGDAAAKGAGEFEDADALRAIAEGRVRDAIALREGNELMAERTRQLGKQEQARRSLADVQASLDAARLSNAPVFAALDEVAAALSLDDLKVLKERIEGERDLAAITAAGDNAVRGASKEFDDIEGLRKAAEDRAKEAIALRKGNEQIAERTRQLGNEAQAKKSLADAEAALERARAAAAPVAQAALKIPDTSGIVDFKKVVAERKRQEDALAVTAAGEAAARGAGDFGNPAALRAVAEEMERINQTRRDNNDLITKGGEALKEQAAAQARIEKAALKANRAMLDGFADAIREGRDLEDVLKRVAIQLAEVAVKGLLDGATGDVSGGKGFLGDLFTGLGGSLFGALDPFGVESYEGGGDTRRGPRVGGLDGKGGYMAMIHPNERIEDLTRPRGGRDEAAGAVTYAPTFQINGSGQSDSQIRRMLEHSQRQGLENFQDAATRGVPGFA